MKQQPTLCVRGLTIQRGYRTLVDGLDFSLDPGEILHLRGPNGCGKTSVLEVLAGLRHAEAGQVDGPSMRESIWLGHRHGFSPELSAIENLLAWCALHGGVAERLPDAMRHWQVPRAVTRGLGALSAGQQQRTALATLRLKSGTHLWMLDEPAAALDVTAVPLLAAELEAFADAGGAVLLSTHQDLGLRACRTLDLRA